MKFAQSKGRASGVRPFKNATPRARAARTLRMPSVRRMALFTAFAWASLTAATAMADTTLTNPDAAPKDTPEADLNIQAQQTSQWTGFWNRGTMLGDIGGLRPWLGKYGITFGLTETSEYLYNTRVPADLFCKPARTDSATARLSAAIGLPNPRDFPLS